MRSLPSSNVIHLSFSWIDEDKWVLSYILATMVTNLTHADSYFERMNKSMGDKSKIMDLLPESGRILDVGCGSGDFMRILEDHGYDVRGIDASEESVKRSGRKSVLGYADELPQHFEDSYFDAVICSSVFHEVFSYGNRDGCIGNVSSLSSTLLSIHRVLKRGGKLVVMDGVCPRTSSDKSKNEHVTMKAPADEVRRFLSNSPFAQPRDSSVDRHVELHQIDDNTFPARSPQSWSSCSHTHGDAARLREKFRNSTGFSLWKSMPNSWSRMGSSQRRWRSISKMDTSSISVGRCPSTASSRRRMLSGHTFLLEMLRVKRGNVSGGFTCRTH